MILSIQMLVQTTGQIGHADIIREALDGVTGD
jgi:hypothetical protein